MKAQEVNIDISKLSSLNEFSLFFEGDAVEKLAKETGFICRSSSKLTGEAFLKMTVQNILPANQWSLNDQCDYLGERHGIEMTKQSLDERYHTFTVSFLKSCYQCVLAQSLQETVKGLNCKFSGIYLTDSTSFQLPPYLACFYQSGGGDTSGASIKIQQTIELLKFQIRDFHLTDGKRGDANYWKREDFEWGKNNLWMADLGHFSWEVFTRIAKSESYFVSRYKTGSTLYIKNRQGRYEPLDMEEYVKSIAAQNTMHSAEVYFGKDKIKGRLICQQVPEEVKQERLRKYRQLYIKQSKQKHWEMTAAKELLCGYNLYITNAPEEKIKDEDVFLIYGLRWQIELLFKIWKSLLFLDKVGEMNIFRFECFLYGRLIFILLSTELLSFIKSTLEDSEAEVEISEWKTMKLIKKNFAGL